jgi:hypothetical protein
MKKSASLPDLLPSLSHDSSDAPRRSRARSQLKKRFKSVVSFLPKSQHNMDTTPVTHWSVLGLIFWASLLALVEVRAGFTRRLGRDLTSQSAGFFALPDYAPIHHQAASGSLRVVTRCR